MDWIASWFSSSGVSFRSGSVATKMAEGSERQFRLLRHNNLKRKSRAKKRTKKMGREHFFFTSRICKYQNQRPDPQDLYSRPLRLFHSLPSSGFDADAPRPLFFRLS